jgi:unsaturated rhamnogalacturonyl hydrolase
MTDTRQALLDQLTSVATGLARIKGINETAPLAGAGFSLQFEEWDWEIGVGLYGLFRHAETRGDAALRAAIGDWYDGQIAAGLPARQVNSTAPMLALAGLIDHAERPDWEALVRDWAEWLMHGAARTEDGGLQHTVKEGPNTGELWDDTLFMTGLFLAKAGRRFGRADWVEEAFYQFLVHARYLADPVTGLWYHGWTFEGRHNFARAFWARGNAWITAGIPELFSIAGPLPGPARRHLASLLAGQVATLARLQRPDGFFTTLLDDTRAPIEASATAGIAYGVMRGVALGLLPDCYAPMAERACAAVCGAIGSDGIVAHVSDGTPMGNDLQFYRDIPDIPAPYGQALTMLMLVEALQKVPA